MPKVSYSRHKISLGAPLRDIRVQGGGEPLISEKKFRRMLEEQFRRGVEMGQKTLREELVEQRTQLRNQLVEIQNGVIRSIERAFPSVIAECEKSIVALALESARRVVQGMPIDAALVQHTVTTALAELKDTAEYEVRLNPDDLALLTRVESDLLPPPENRQVRFVADASVA